MAYTYYINALNYINALILLVVGVVFWTYPPKKINGLYGYRTTRSCKSQEAWDFAQRYSAKLITMFGLPDLVVAAIAHWLRNCLCFHSDFLMLYDITIKFVLPLIVAIPPIVLTESELRKRFGFGNRLNFATNSYIAKFLEWHQLRRADVCVVRLGR
jgi:uncharacterized membrane protein